jgi:hypothetical protein
MIVRDYGVADIRREGGEGFLKSPYLRIAWMIGHKN